MKSTKLVFNNEKVVIDLPSSGSNTLTGATGTGHVLVYHADIDKLALGTSGATINESNLVHKTGDERISGGKQFDDTLYANSIQAATVNANYFIGDGSQLTNLPTGSGGGSSISGFTRSGTTVTIATTQASLDLDLNATTYGPGALVTVDLPFQVNLVAFNNPTPGQWYYLYNGWSNIAGGGVHGDNTSSYLIQDFNVTQDGDFRIHLTLTEVDGGFVHLFGTGFDLGYFTAPGTYDRTVTLSNGVNRLYIKGENFTGNINEGGVYSTATVLQFPYGQDLFVHKSGNETVAGNKLFTGNIDAKTYLLNGLPIITYAPDVYGQPSFIFGDQRWDTTSLFRTGHYTILETGFFCFSAKGTGAQLNIDNGANLNAQGSITAQNGFVGDGSRLTNLPVQTGLVPYILPFLEFTATADGAQHISLQDGASGALNVQVLEANPSSGTTPSIVRPIYNGHCLVDTGNLLISADANIKAGDKLSGFYFSNVNKIIKDYLKSPRFTAGNNGDWSTTNVTIGVGQAVFPSGTAASLGQTLPGRSLADYTTYTLVIEGQGTGLYYAETEDYGTSNPSGPIVFDANNRFKVNVTIGNAYTYYHNVYITVHNNNGAGSGTITRVSLLDT